MEHDDALDAIRQAWADEARFFSTARQSEQERWVVREFLTRLGVRFAEPELVSEETHSKVDVVFRDVRFQVKEIPDPGTRRGDEVNALWRQAVSAKRVEDIVGLDIAPAADACLRPRTRQGASAGSEWEVQGPGPPRPPRLRDADAGLSRTCGGGRWSSTGFPRVAVDLIPHGAIRPRAPRWQGCAVAASCCQRQQLTRRSSRRTTLAVCSAQLPSPTFPHTTGTPPCAGNRAVC